MGADGHIGIYDFEKFKNNYDDEIVNSFLGHFLSSKFYQQDLNGKKYLTRYWGDNYDCSDLYDAVQDTYLTETDTFNTKSWSYSSHQGEYFMEYFDKDTRLFFRRMIDYLESDCRLTSWEVWT